MLSVIAWIVYVNNLKQRLAIENSDHTSSLMLHKIMGRTATTPTPLHSVILFPGVPSQLSTSSLAW